MLYFLGQGYRRIKMKIGPGRDLEFLRAVRGRWPDVLLMADANWGTASSVVNVSTTAPIRAEKRKVLMASLP